MEEFAKMMREMKEVLEEIRKKKGIKRENREEREEDGARGGAPRRERERRKEEGIGRRPEDGRKKSEEEQRKEKKRNVVIKGIKGRKNWEEEMARIVREAGGEDIKVRRMWDVGCDRGVVVVELGSERERDRVMRRKEGIEERERVKLLEDLTYKEREERWWKKEKERGEKEVGKPAKRGGRKTEAERKWKVWSEEKKEWREEGASNEDRGEEEEDGEKRKEKEEWSRKLIEALNKLHKLNRREEEKEMDKEKKKMD